MVYEDDGGRIPHPSGGGTSSTPSPVSDEGDLDDILAVSPAAADDGDGRGVEVGLGSNGALNLLPSWSGDDTEPFSSPPPGPQNPGDVAAAGGGDASALRVAVGRGDGGNEAEEEAGVLPHATSSMSTGLSPSFAGQGSGTLERALREARMAVGSGDGGVGDGGGAGGGGGFDGGDGLGGGSPSSQHGRVQSDAAFSSASDENDDDGDDENDDDDVDPGIDEVYANPGSPRVDYPGDRGGVDGGRVWRRNDDDDEVGSVPSSDADDGDAVDKIASVLEDPPDGGGGGRAGGLGGAPAAPPGRDFLSRASNAVLEEVLSNDQGSDVGSSSAGAGGGEFDDAGWRAGGRAADPQDKAEMTRQRLQQQQQQQPQPPPPPPGGGAGNQTPSRRIQHLQRLQQARALVKAGGAGGSVSGGGSSVGASATTATTTGAGTSATSAATTATSTATSTSAAQQQQQQQPLQQQRQPADQPARAQPTRSRPPDALNADDLQAGVLPDVLMTMRQKIESLTLFDSDMIRLSSPGGGGGRPMGPGGGGGADNPLMAGYYDDDEARESKEQLRRSFQQSISAAVLVSLAHKRYERRRLAAMEIEKVVRSLVQQGELDRVRAILLLLSDDYVRSTSEDARKGGVVALAASAIGLKKADETNPDVRECRDLILASVVHACQDHSQRVRYYATESLFNVVKVIPTLAVQHFFILFEILRSLYADVDLDVRSGAELLDKKLKEVIVGAINAGQFTADACVPLFARFVHMKNKPTKRLTLTWLQEFVEKLLGAPILEFLHLFLGGVFAMVADPNQPIRELSLSFLQSVLPKLLEHNEDFDDGGFSTKVDFDKILQSLVTTMEHPDPFVRKVAMYWMSRIVQAHMGERTDGPGGNGGGGGDSKDNVLKRVGSAANGTTGLENGTGGGGVGGGPHLTAASVSVRNSLPHVLPGILLSIGDTFHVRHGTAAKDSFLPDQTTHSLAEQTNTCLQDAVRRDGSAYVPHLDGFIVALREELDSPGGLGGRNPPAIERKPYRMDVKPDGSGIESTGWFRASSGTSEERDDAMMMSRLCALQWVTVLYEYVVPDSLKAEYAREFITPIIHQLVYEPPELIVFKSFEVLAKITVPVKGEEVMSRAKSFTWVPGITEAPLPFPLDEQEESSSSPELQPMSDANALFALDILDSSRRHFKSRDREVFAVLIHLHSHNHRLLTDLSTVIEFMCTLQPPEFVFVSFALELDRFVVQRIEKRRRSCASAGIDERKVRRENASFTRDLEFVSSFVQQMNNVLLNSSETAQLREVLKNSIGSNERGDRGERKARLFHILIHAFAHNLAATLSLCLWGGAYLSASTFLHQIDPLDVNLLFYLEIDELVELLERPLFRDLHLLMLECDKDPSEEGSGAMLFTALKSLLMLIPQSTSYNVLKDRLLTVSRFRQSTIYVRRIANKSIEGTCTEVFVNRVRQIRKLHCDAKWRMIRAETLEPVEIDSHHESVDEAAGRREWLGYANEEEEIAAKKRARQQMHPRVQRIGEEGVYDELHRLDNDEVHNFKTPDQGPDSEQQSEIEGKTSNAANEMESSEQANGEAGKWKDYWEHSGAEEKGF